VLLWQNWVSRFDPHVVVIYASPVFYLANDPPAFPAPRIESAAAAVTRPISAMTQSAGFLPHLPAGFSSRLVERLKDRIDFPDFIQRRRVMKKIAYATRGQPDEWFYQSVPAERLALFREHLDSLVTDIRAAGAVPVLVTHAMRFGDKLDPLDHDLLRSWRQFTPRATETVLMRFEVESAAMVRELARDRDLPIADVAALMTGQTRWFADFTHFNDQGAGVAAQSIARAVLSARVTPRPVQLTAAR
jgi:hypothetical protein